MEFAAHSRGSGKAPTSALNPTQRLNSEGSVALEFALVSLPFMFLVFALLELSMIFIMSDSLSNAMAVAAQEIRVGSVVATSVSTTVSSGSQLDIADFKQLVCSNIAFISAANCVTQLQIDVRTLSGYQNKSSPAPLSGQTFDARALCFYSGSAGSVVEVTGYYLWPMLSMPVLNALSNTTTLTTSNGSIGGSWFTITTTEVLKTEPNAAISNLGSGC